MSADLSWGIFVGLLGIVVLGAAVFGLQARGHGSGRFNAAAEVVERQVLSDEHADLAGIVEEVRAARSQDVGALEDVQLCRLWRCTYPPLVAPHSAKQWGVLVEIRASVLGELVRRDPDGWARWRDSGARAGGDPLRYLTSVQSAQDRGAAPPKAP